MKEAIIHKGTEVEIVDSPIPEPKPDEVIIQVVVSGCNPKDWKLPEWTGIPLNQGDDIGGVVYKVGADVTEFKEGDLVAALHEMMTPGGSYAEYALEEAAAIPLAALTAALGLYVRLELSEPWRPATKTIPLVIYGAASAVGAYAVQFAAKSNVHPIIAVAGKSIAHVEKFIDPSKGDVIIDYREGDEAIVENIKKALLGSGLHHAFDAVSDKSSINNLRQVLAEGSKLATVWPSNKEESVADHIEEVLVYVGSAHKEDADFAYLFSRYLGPGLLEGWFKPQPQEVVPGGLDGISQGLENLKAGRANAVKYVFRIAETEGHEH
ncbi:hypothetical protein QWA68_014248 [Fusarium oxysporum]|nr:hypothetical protein QWA68_014248 [Fusarium oxysporum]